MSTIWELCKRRLAEGHVPPGTAEVLRRLEKSRIAGVKAPGKASDYIAHCRERRQKVTPATTAHDVVALRGVLAYAKPGWDMENVTDAPIREAMPILRKEGLIGSSKRRTRIPSDAERETLKARWLSRPRQSRLPMPDIIDFSYYSTRRPSETFRLQRGDYSAAEHSIMVRDMKHPRRKVGNNRVVALPAEAEEILLRQPRLSDDPTERFFPFNTETVERAFAALVAECGMIDLEMRDLRRGGNTWLLKKYPPQYVMLVTGHETIDMPTTTYNGMTAADFRGWTA